MQALKNKGIIVNHKKVYRIMCESGLKAIIRKKYCRRKYIKVNVVPNMLNREFESDKPHKKLVCDVTELKRIGDKRYFLYSILDLYNNEILTAHISYHNDYGLVKQGLDGLALQSDNAILHSDQGAQFTSRLYMEWAAQNNITLSMSRVGNCYDNAAKESFFGHFKEEFYIYYNPKTQEELLENISSFINYYNNDRIQMRFKMSPKQYAKSQNFSH
jgi:transposase InsO family protein